MASKNEIQELINKSRPAEVGEYTKLSFSNVVEDQYTLSASDIDDFNFKLKEGFENFGVVTNPNLSKNGLIIPLIGKCMNLGKAYPVENKFDGVARWSPSRVFPTYKFINNQMFEKEKNLIFFKTSEIFNTNMKDAVAYYNVPFQDIKHFSEPLAKQIANLIGNRHSRLHRCLLWIHVIENIIRPKHKPFIEEAPEKKGVYPEKNVYYDIKHIIVFPKNFEYTLKDLHNAFDSHFKKWLLQFIKNDTGFIDLFPYAEDPNDTIMDNVMWAINHFFESERNINSYPVVVDEKFGKYSTIDTLYKLFESINMSTTKVYSASAIYKLKNMDDYCDTHEYDGIGYHGWSDQTQYYLNLQEYGYNFAKAVNEILTRDIFNKYNRSVAVHAVMENMAIVMPDVDVESDIVYFDKLKKDTVSEDLYINAGHVDYNPNDMRYKLRDNSIKGGIKINLQDYNWSMNIQELSEMGLTVDDFQNLTIYEFQPDQNISFKRLSDSTIGQIDNWISGNGVVQAMTGTLLTKVVNATAVDIKGVRDFSANVSWIDQMLSGYYVGIYDIPYFGSRFIGTDTTESWSMGNLLSDKEFLVNDLTLNIQDIPTWKYNQGQSKELQTTFFLLNKNVNDIIRNMKFLFSFASGAYWIQSSNFGYRPPNLYRIFCPGRFIMLYAAMGIDIEFVGKVRRYSSEDAKLMFGNNSDFAPLNVMIEQAKSCNIPEAYKISVNFKDLTPGAFNILAAYFTNTSSKNDPNNKDAKNNVNIFPDINTKYERKFAGFRTFDEFEDKAKEGIKDSIDKGMFRNL